MEVLVEGEDVVLEAAAEVLGDEELEAEVLLASQCAVGGGGRSRVGGWRASDGFQSPAPPPKRN